MGNVNYSSPSEEFWYACKEPTEEKALTFIKTKLPIDEVEKKNLLNFKKEGMTPLLLATQHGHLILVQKLLELGALPQALDDKYGMGPVLIAAKEGRKELIDYFMTLRWGIDSMNTRDVLDKSTPLYWAAFNNHGDVVAALIDGNEDKSSPSSSSSSNPTNKLTFSGVDPNQIGSLLSGASPLFIACQRNMFDAVKVLTEKGADIDFLWRSGATPIFIASQNGHDVVVAWLLSRHADMNKPRTDGATPVRAASFNNHYNALTLLIAAGADVNYRGRTKFNGPNDGESALITAVGLGFLDIVELLLLAGADDSIVLPDGNTPYTVAVLNNKMEILSLLHYYRLGRLQGIFEPYRKINKEIDPSSPLSSSSTKVQREETIPELPLVSSNTLKQTISTNDKMFGDILTRRQTHIDFIEQQYETIQRMSRDK